MDHLNEVMSDMDIDDKNQDSEFDYAKDSLLNCVAKSDGFFKSQQIGEKDLTFTEKREIASELLDKNVPVFLQRYWKFIKLDDVPFFDSYRSNYEVNFYVTEIIKCRNARKNRVKVRNRRYEALKQMVDEGSYFSDADMRKRNPLLYDQMIGQHLTENERIAAYKEQHQDEKFSTFLMDQLERNEENCLFKKQKDEDDAEAVIEYDDDTSEEECDLKDEPVRKIITDQEKSLLRCEFINIMYESFLEGKDKDFDYSSVDDNVEYDSVKQRDIDEQEKYFDDESSQSVCSSD